VQGARCLDCIPNFFGPQCRQACPGGVCSPCSNHGTCNDGVLGNGTCNCFSDVSSGFWTGYACTECQSGYYGATCTTPCGCGIHGSCNDGVAGNGFCVCSEGWFGPNCTTCETGFFFSDDGLDCLRCPGYSAITKEPCSGQGECDRRGVCWCKSNFGGAACEVLSPGAVSPCDGRQCRNNATCTFGQCNCPRAFTGVNCEFACPSVTLSGQSCSGHGTCFENVTAARAQCICSVNFDPAYNCSQCIDGFGGVDCNTSCLSTTQQTQPSQCNYRTLGVLLATLCSKTTGQCNCSAVPGACGPTCEDNCTDTACDKPTPHWGPRCENPCDCVNGTCVDGKNGTGACICAPTFAGKRCNLTCAGDGRCSGNGQCNVTDGSCKCAEGFAGFGCQIACPGVLNGSICSGQGNCSDGATGNGLCRCNTGFVGVNCSTKCQCKSPQFGECDPTGACHCLKNSWRVGSDCSSCAQGRSGPTCRVACKNGVTNGSNCDCFPTYGGAGCASQCALGGNLTCSGVDRGTCSEGESGTGLCVCKAGYFGPGCNCSSETCSKLFGNDHGRCDETSGQCVCKAQFSGPSCTQCSRRSYGFDCSELCACKNGYCLQDGTCSCFSDDLRGYWTGSECTTCVAGYNEPDCIQQATSNSQLASIQLFISSEGLFSSNRMLLLEQEDAVLVFGDVLAVFKGVSQTTVEMVHLSSGSVLGCSTIVLSWVENESNKQNATIAIVTNCVPSVFIYHEFRLFPLERLYRSGPLVTVTITLTRLLTTNTIIHYRSSSSNTSHIAGIAAFGVGSSGDQITLLFDVDINATLNSAANDTSSQTVRKLPLDFAVSTIVGLLYDSSYDLLLVIGVVDTTVVGEVVRQGGTVIFTVDPKAWVTPLQVHFFKQFPVALTTGSIQGWLFIQVAQNTGLTSYLRIRISDVVSRNTTSLLLPNAAPFAKGDVVASIDFDPSTSNLILAVNNGVNSKFVQLRLRESEYTMVGSQQSPMLDDRRYAACAVSNSSRLAFFLQARASGIAIRRYVLVQITTMLPQISDRRGGTVISVTGEGFAFPFPERFKGGAQCRIESSGVRYTVNATVINSTLLTCVTLLASSSICSPDIVEVAIYNSYFTTNSLLLSRYDDPLISSVRPDKQAVTALRPVTVYGTNFQLSPVTLCSFTWHNQSGGNSSREVRITRGRIHSDPADSTAIVCDPPAGSVSAGRALVDVACDGTVFSGLSSSYVNFTSSAAAILTSPATVELNSSYAVLPPIVVSFLDSSGLPLGDLFTDFVEVRTTLLTQGAVLHGNDSVYITSGIGIIPRLELLNSTVGVKLIEFSVVGVFGNAAEYSWKSVVSVTVIPGAPHQVVVVVSPARFIPEVNTISEVDVQIEDSAGNTVTTGLKKFTANFTVVSFPVVTVPDSILAFFANPDPRPATSLSSFSDITYRAVQSAKLVHARAGFEFFVRISVFGGNYDVLPAETHVITTSCLPGRVRLIGSFQCQECPENCDCSDLAVYSSSTGALNVRVKPGFWRYGLHATKALECDPLSSCLGGNNTGECAEGYLGPLCGLCAPGYGRSLIGAQCTECPSPSLSFTMFVAAIGLVLVLVVLVIVSAVQNAEGLSEIVLLVKLLVMHMHSVMAVGSLHVHFPDFLRLVLAWCGIFSARVLDYYFSDCVLSTGGGKNSFFTKFVIFAVTPAISAVLASVAWLSLTIAPNFLRFKVGESKVQRRRERRELAKRLRELFRQQKEQAKALAALEGKSEKAPTSVLVSLRSELAITERLVRDAEMEYQQHKDADRQGRTRGNTQQQEQPGTASTEYDKLSYRHLSFTSVQVLVFFTFPATVFYAFLLSRCRSFNDGLGGVTRLLIVDLTVDCDSPLSTTYYASGMVVGCCFLIFAPLIFSVVCFLKLRQARERLAAGRRRLSHSFSFTLLGIKEGSWFWAPLSLIRLGLQSVIVATVPLPQDIQVLSWLLVFFVVLLFRVNPYWEPSHLRLEALSMSSCLVAANLAVLFPLASDSPTSWKSTVIGAVELCVLLFPIMIYLVLLSKRPREWLNMKFHRVVLAKDVTESESSGDDDEAFAADSAGASDRTVKNTRQPPTQIQQIPTGHQKQQQSRGFDEIFYSDSTKGNRFGAPSTAVTGTGEESPAARRSRELLAALSSRAAQDVSRRAQRPSSAAPIQSSAPVNLRLLLDDDASSDEHRAGRGCRDSVSSIELDLEEDDEPRPSQRNTGGRHISEHSRFGRFDQRRAEMPPRFTVVKPATGITKMRVSAALNDDDSSDNEIF
jgi:hypothetical protein